MLAALTPGIVRGDVEIEILSKGADAPAIGLGASGLYKLDRWTPVRVKLRCKGGIFKGHLGVRDRDVDGDLARYQIGPMLINGQGANGVVEAQWLYAKLADHDGDRTARIELQLLDADGSVLVRRKLPATPSRLTRVPRAMRIVMVCGAGGDLGLMRRALWYDQSARSQYEQRTSLEEVYRALSVGPNQLPDSWMGYDAVHTLILTAPTMSLIRDNAKWDAIRHWVERGGHLIIAIHSLANSISADPKLSEFLGIEAGQPTPLEVHSNSFIEPTRAAVIPMKPLKGTAVDRQEPWATVAKAALITQRNCGTGLVTCLGVNLRDLHAGAKTNLIMRLARLEPIFSEVTANYDPTRNLEGMVQKFPGSSVGWAIPLILIYAALAGPLHWWLTRRGRRARWAWVTFFLIGVAGSVTTYLLVTAVRGSKVEVYQIHVLDVEANTPRVHGTTYAGVLSTLDTVFDLRTHGGDGVVTALGRREDLFGQQFPVASHYRIHVDHDLLPPPNDPASCKDAPMRNAVKCFESRWRTNNGGGLIETRLTWDGRRIRGILRNRTQLTLGPGWLLIAHRSTRKIAVPGRSNQRVERNTPSVQLVVYRTRSLDPGDTLTAQTLGRAYTGEQLVRRINADLPKSSFDLITDNKDSNSALRLNRSIPPFYRLVLAASLTRYYHRTVRYQDEQYSYQTHARFGIAQMEHLDISDVLQPGKAVYIAPVTEGRSPARIQPMDQPTVFVDGPVVLRCSIPVTPPKPS